MKYPSWFPSTPNQSRRDGVGVADGDGDGDGVADGVGVGVGATLPLPIARRKRSYSSTHDALAPSPRKKAGSDGDSLVMSEMTPDKTTSAHRSSDGGLIAVFEISSAHADLERVIAPDTLCNCESARIQKEPVGWSALSTLSSLRTPWGGRASGPQAPMTAATTIDPVHAPSFMGGDGSRARRNEGAAEFTAER
jgi:hypothetical protein